MKENKMKKTMTPMALSRFCDQVAMMLKAGMSLEGGMEVLAEKEKENSAFSVMHKRLAETGSLYEAMQESGLFPAYLTEMTGIGEKTGHLEDVMRSMTAYYEREGRLKESLRNAVAYPLVLGGMLFVIVLILLWQVLPVFERVLSGMGITGTDSGLMRVGAVLGWVVLAAVGLMLLLVLLCLVLTKTRYKDKVLSLLRRCIPALGTLTDKISASRVAAVLSMMLSGGFVMEEALSTVPRVLEDEEAVKKIDRIAKAVEEGEAFSDAVAEAELFDVMHTRLLQTGAMTGTEDEVMEKIAKTYEEETENSIGSLIAVIEPTVVVVLSIVIGAVLLSVMLPMAGVLSSLL
ncbi:MAG: type II secretion system F family protein [Clostridia bacterium]|nr:type II secretion system F family protein [Clostridia bacterium]